MKLIFIFILVLSSCSKNSEAVKRHDDSIAIVREDSIAKIAKEDSFIALRKQNDSESLSYINRDRKYFGENLNLSLRDFLGMLNNDLNTSENILEVNGWHFYSKNEYVPREKTGKSDLIGDILDEFKVGKYLKYRNRAEDTEILIAKRPEIKDEVIISTTNPFNYRQLIEELNKENFASKEGLAFEDPKLDFGNKNYIGELAIVDTNRRKYLKDNYEVYAFTYIRSPVTKIEKTTETMNGYTFSYDPSVKVTEYVISFKIE